ncbi:MAG: hypothetical protein M1401_06865 [Chloroflexi bacterium]|nr:hypothetical protein [Chloroflexota bacterium]
MNLIVQVAANVVLYGFFLWQAYESLFVEHDYWFAFVVLFVLFVAVVTSLIPGIRAPRTSPGAYPFED